MITLTTIFRRYGAQYRAGLGAHLPSSQRQAMRAIEQCRTPALGGQIYRCERCATQRYCYHSCRNRHCPTCQQDAAQAWLKEQQVLLLDVPYFLVTFTLPSGLRLLAAQQPRLLYTLLFRASAAALQQLAHDPRFVGGQIGMLGVLQTWTRDLRFHPHVHYLVPAIGLAADGQLRRPRNPAFLVAVKPLAMLFRAKLRAGLRQSTSYQQVAQVTWQQEWIVDCRRVGNGAAALNYLARYIFRVALSNSSIVGLAQDRVTFRYRDGKTKQLRSTSLPAERFIERFLAHVLPRGFVKVRYYGLLRSGNRRVLAQMREQLGLAVQGTTAGRHRASVPRMPDEPASMRCPVWGQPMQRVELIARPIRAPPACG